MHESKTNATSASTRRSLILVNPRSYSAIISSSSLVDGPTQGAVSSCYDIVKSFLEGDKKVGTFFSTPPIYHELMELEI